jgi:putative redox protein
MNLEIRFPGGLAVDAVVGGLTIHTDQPVVHGGGGTGPMPFDLFLASLGTCAGLYALRFCQQRGIPTHGLGLTLEAEKDPAGGRIGTVRFHLRLPLGFPEKYHDAIERAVDQCAVKRHIAEPPLFETVTVPAEAAELVA